MVARKGEQAGKGRSQGSRVTDYQRARALIWLSQSEEVGNPEVERVLRTVSPTYVVRVRQTPTGSIYRVTLAGQRWAMSTLASSVEHGGTAHGGTDRKSSANHLGSGPASTGEPVVEARGSEWRVVDYTRRVRTPWLASDVRTRVMESAARMAVRRTSRDRLTNRHTRDGEWVIVHSL